jgi:hypothetical protein
VSPTKPNRKINRVSSTKHFPCCNATAQLGVIGGRAPRDTNPVIAKKKALKAPAPGGVHCGQDKMLTSFQIEIFLGFFSTTKFHDLNHTLRNHPLLTPLQTRDEELSEARHLLSNFSQLALETAEKIYVEVGGGFYLKFVYFLLGLSDRSVNVYTNFKSKPHQLQRGFSQPF